MRSLLAAEMLQFWEDVSDKPLLEKSLGLLGIAYSANDINELAYLSIGQRDARLLQLRESMFGHSLRNKINCSNCGETIEWEMDSRQLHLQAISPDLSVKEYSLHKDGIEIQFRLPGSVDVSKVLLQDGQQSFKKVIEHCIIKIHKDGEPCSFNDLPEAIIEALSDRMSAEEPQADICMDINCPSCNYRWEANFDISGYLWSEINNWAYRMLHQIYVLAKTFGWSEKDILNMSANRRQLYIEMIQG